MAGRDRYSKSPKIKAKAGSKGEEKVEGKTSEKESGSGEDKGDEKKAKKTAGDKTPTKHEKNDGKGGAEPEVDEGDEGMPMVARHSMERSELHQRHMREKDGLHNRHEREHMEAQMKPEGAGL